MIAVTGAAKAVTCPVTAVTRAVTPALNVTSTVPALTAVAGGLPRSFQAEGPGLFRLTRGCRSLINRSLARRSCDGSARHESPLSLDLPAVAPLSVASLLTMPRATLRSQLRSQGPKDPLLGSSHQAAAGARIVPWWQPGDWVINLTGRLHRASPL